MAKLSAAVIFGLALLAFQNCGKRSSEGSLDASSNSTPSDLSEFSADGSLGRASVQAVSAIKARGPDLCQVALPATGVYTEEIYYVFHCRDAWASYGAGQFGSRIIRAYKVFESPGNGRSAVYSCLLDKSLQGQIMSNASNILCSGGQAPSLMGYLSKSSSTTAPNPVYTCYKQISTISGSRRLIVLASSPDSCRSRGYQPSSLLGYAAIVNPAQ